MSHEAAAEKQHPLLETLGAFVAGVDWPVPISIGPMPPERAFLGSNLAQPGHSALQDALRRQGGYWRTESAFLSAALFMLGYTHPLAHLALCGFYAGQRVPDVSGGNYAVCLDDDGGIESFRLLAPRFAALRDDPAAGHPDAFVVPDRESLRAWLISRLHDQHLTPLFTKVRTLTKLSANVLWGNVASIWAAALEKVTSEGLVTLEQALAEKTELLDQLGSPLRGRVSVYSLESKELRRLFHRRNTCCQKYLHPDMGKCGYCSLRTADETLQLQRGWMDRLAAQAAGHADAKLV
jgi:hypothetical protein